MLLIVPILHLVLPDFQQQKKVENLAAMMNKSENEIEQMNQNAILRFLANQLERKSFVDMILGENRRMVYMSLDKKDSYGLFLAKALLKSFSMVPFFIIAGLWIHVPILHVMGVLTVGLLFWSALDSIKKEMKKRQATIIRDLPSLISKMIGALEVGTPLIQVFDEVSQTSSPVLSSMLKKLISNSGVVSMKVALQGFAKSVNLPEMYDFISVVNVINEKGFREAEEDLKQIDGSLQRLSKQSMEERTRGNPEKMTIYYALAICMVLGFLVATVVKMSAMVNSI
ncbi:hypothetical protein [Paenibacillus polymyxa]|uniref:hypothetical protein n=1 Tax=Paenibacillus polymyxa TaxID=1406 RepID=UPI001118B0A0|nr:hypothetical protein [Paenibacillus polymyxa]QDA30212.1 hypothetical protein FGY93_25165 [Paenibacillus polymyxa]